MRTPAQPSLPPPVDRLSLIIPFLNERDNLVPLYERVVAALASSGLELELIFVDDGSTDGSAEQVAALHAQDPRVKLLSFSRNFGHQVALTAGMDHATGAAAVMLDADGQHPPELIPELVRLWRAGHDVVYTVRTATDDAGPLKRLTARAYYALFNRLTGVDQPANAADFRLLDRKVLEAFKGIRERGRFLRGLTSWVGFRQAAVPFVAPARTRGTSKYDMRRMLRFALEGILAFSTIPLTLAFFVGLAMATLSAAYMAYVLWAWYYTSWVITGWTSLIIMVSLIGGLQLVLMGIMGLYIGKIYDEAKQRPLYLLQRQLGFGPAAEAPRP